jgi:hypothetical protein
MDYGASALLSVETPLRWHVTLSCILRQQIHLCDYKTVPSSSQDKLRLTPTMDQQLALQITSATSSTVACFLSSDSHRTQCFGHALLIGAVYGVDTLTVVTSLRLYLPAFSARSETYGLFACVLEPPIQDVPGDSASDQSSEYRCTQHDMAEHIQITSCFPWQSPCASLFSSARALPARAFTVLPGTPRACAVSRILNPSTSRSWKARRKVGVSRVDRRARV